MGKYNPPGSGGNGTDDLQQRAQNHEGKNYFDAPFLPNPDHKPRSIPDGGKAMDEELKSLVPKSKSDVETARAAIAAGFPKIEPILPDLMEWLQDCNWPVALELRPFLSTIGLPLLPHIKFVLSSNDDIWKSWVLSMVMDSRDLYVALKEDLFRIAYHPTASEKLEEVDERAQGIIDFFEGGG